MNGQSALIVGAGGGLSASIGRLCARDGMRVALASRDLARLNELAAAIGARGYCCDASDPASVAALFDGVLADTGVPDLVVFNASARARGPVDSLDVDAVRQALMVSCYGGFLVGSRAAREMLPRASGTIVFTGASASVKGFANSASFAMGKFGLRGLAQSMARELAPKGIHVGHVVVDGGIASSHAESEEDRASDRWLDPNAIAETYLHLHRQHRSAWTWEVEVRPWVEKF